MKKGIAILIVISVFSYSFAVALEKLQNASGTVINPATKESTDAINETLRSGISVTVAIPSGTNNIGDVDIANFPTTAKDAFGRLKVSSPVALFDNASEYGNNTYFWESLVSGGSITAIPNQNAIRLSTGGTTSGNYAIRQTKQYIRYQPGRSLNVEQSFTMGAAQTNAIARIGYFDDRNGIFLERNGSTINIVRRTYVSGAAVDNSIAQALWNGDKLNGTGTSGFTLDLTKTNIFFVQLQYLGVGRVQVGFVINGEPIVAHEFFNANNLPTVYMSTGSLPIRSEVRNTGVGSGTLTMDTICTSVSTGGTGVERIRYSRSNGSTGISTTTTLVPLISIRAATLMGGTTGGGAVTNRAQIFPKEVSVAAVSQIHEYQIVLNGSLTGASWQNNGTLSIADYDISASAISGGTVLSSGYVAASSSVRGSTDFNQLEAILPLVYASLNSTQDIITIAARTVTGNGTAFGAITWDEQF